MTPEELKSISDQLGTKTANEIKSAIDAARAGDAEKMTAMEAKLLNELGADSPHIKAMQTQLDKITTDQQKAMIEKQEIKAIQDHLIEVGRSEEFKSIRSNGKKLIKEIPINFKASTILNSSMTNVLPKPSWIPGVFRAPDQAPFISQLCPVVPTNSDIVYYVNRLSRTNGAAAQTEGLALGQSDLNWTQASANVSDIGSFMKVSDNALGDNDFVMGEINAELPWMVLNAQDAAILALIDSGSTAFSATGKPWLNGVRTPNRFDVLRAAIGQARGNNFRPDAVLINEDDYGMMEMEKNLDGSYVIPQFYSAAGIRVSNVPVIPSTTVTSGSFFVCTLARTPLAMRQNLIVEFGYDADDFSKRLITVRAYVRSAYVFSTQMAGGFIDGTFDAAIALITKS